MRFANIIALQKQNKTNPDGMVYRNRIKHPGKMYISYKLGKTGEIWLTIRRKKAMI
jgi:hypothetical protein